ncbi:MAG: SusD/RagB family nutrient-binding outer membrane lipoprotein [Balneolaceae bacterium]
MNRNKMNYFKSMSTGLAVLLIAIAAGCTDGFDAMNTPKDELTVEQIDGSLLGQAFAQSQYTGTMGEIYWWCYMHYTDKYSQVTATTHPNFDSDMYGMIGREILCWDNYYTVPAVQQNFVEEFSEENDMPLENAMAKVWRVQMYHRMSDFYGPIIYSEFGNGEVSVPYDDQETIYRDFFETLDEAVAVFEQHAGENAFGTHDMIYNGDVDQWRRFANSLRLRLAMRVAYVEPELAQTEAEKAVQAGVFETNDEQAMMMTTQDNINWITQWTYIQEYVMSASMHSVMVGYDDPRLPAFFAEAENRPGYQGLRNGVPASMKGADINGDHSFVSETYLPSHRGDQVGPNPPNRVMKTAEVYFLRAEGALRGWNMGGTEEQLYNEGIRASLTDFRPDLSAAEIEAYIVSTDTPVPVPTEEYHHEGRESPPMTDIPVLYQSGADEETRLEQIITQKWLGGFGDTWELWSERRRTGYPVGYALIHNLNEYLDRDDLYRRLIFSGDERINNTAAVEEAEGFLKGPDTPATRLWWDAKPLTDYPEPVD